MPEDNKQGITIDEMKKLINANAQSSVAKLICGATLNDEELYLLSSYTPSELATIAIYLTTEELRKLNDPQIILNAAASIYGQLANNITVDHSKHINYKNNLELIQKFRNQNSATLDQNGPTR